MTEPTWCAAKQARCVCTKPAGHVMDGDDVHACDDHCGGSWKGSEAEGTFEVVTYPGGYKSAGEAIVAAFGISDEW